MSYEGFFENCIRAIKSKQEELIKTLRARVPSSLKNEIDEILQHLEYYRKYGDISEQFYNSAKKRIKEIDFENIAAIRLIIKKKKDNK